MCLLKEHFFTSESTEYCELYLSDFSPYSQKRFHKEAVGGQQVITQLIITLPWELLSWKLPAQQSGHWRPPKQWPRGSLLLNCWCHRLNSQRDSLRQNNLVLLILVWAVLALRSEPKPNYDYVWSVISKSTSSLLSSPNTSYFLYYSLPLFSVLRCKHRRDRRRE